MLDGNNSKLNLSRFRLQEKGPRQLLGSPASMPGALLLCGLSSLPLASAPPQLTQRPCRISCPKTALGKHTTCPED